MNSDPSPLPSLPEDGEPTLELSEVHKPTNLPLSENDRLLTDFTDGSLLPNLERDTQEALRRSEAATPGDEGYAAWLQFKELRKNRRRHGKCMGKVSSIYDVSYRMGQSPSKSLTRSDEPVAFRARNGESVLCLDGGGMKGLVQIEILMQLEEATGRRITELFDWIVGTSTGGILALGLVYGRCVCVCVFTNTHVHVLGLCKQFIYKVRCCWQMLLPLHLLDATSLLKVTPATHCHTHKHACTCTHTHTHTHTHTQTHAHTHTHTHTQTHAHTHTHGTHT